MHIGIPAMYTKYYTKRQIIPKSDKVAGLKREDWIYPVTDF
jgi:hypothetical protein